MGVIEGSGFFSYTGPDRSDSVLIDYDTRREVGNMERIICAYRPIDWNAEGPVVSISEVEIIELDTPEDSQN